MAVLDYYFAKDVVKFVSKPYQQALMSTYKEFLESKTVKGAIAALHKLKVKAVIFAYSEDSGLFRVSEETIRIIEQVENREELAATIVRKGLAKRKGAMVMAKVLEKTGFKSGGEFVQSNGKFFEYGNVGEILDPIAPIFTIMKRGYDTNREGVALAVVTYNNHMAIIIRNGEELAMYDLKTLFSGILTKTDFSSTFGTMDKMPINELLVPFWKQGMEYTTLLRADTFFLNARRIQGIFLLDPALIGDAAESARLANRIKKASELAETMHLPYRDARNFSQAVNDLLNGRGSEPFIRYAKGYPKEVRLWTKYNNKRD